MSATGVARSQQNIVLSMRDKHFQHYKRCRSAALFWSLALMKGRINGGTIHGPLPIKALSAGHQIGELWIIQELLRRRDLRHAPAAQHHATTRDA